jgi:predicted nucleic acid-binding protein
MEFLVFKKYNERESAEALTNLLQAHGIAFEITKDRENLDVLYGDNPSSEFYYVKIRSHDFPKANALLLDIGNTDLNTVDKTHYLFEFTDDELFDILSKPDEWNALDYQLAKKILKERGREVNDETIESLKKQRIAELAKPDESNRIWIFIGYLSIVFGGLFAIIVGWHLFTYKKTLPDGQRVYEYSEKDRRHGRRIFYLGMIVFYIAVAIRLATIKW